jgi:hypothetical protein
MWEFLGAGLPDAGDFIELGHLRREWGDRLIDRPVSASALPHADQRAERQLRI